MSLVVFEHIAAETPATLGKALTARGHRLKTVRIHAGDPVPTDLDGVDGIVSMGGPMNVDQTDQHPWLEAEMQYLREAHENSIPIVGICLGAQLIAAALGGQVNPMPTSEAGWQEIKLAFPGTIDPLHAGMPWTSTQFHLHGQEVTELPPGATPLAGSTLCRNQAFKVGLTTYAFQYHFEWDKPDLCEMARDPIVPKTGQTPEQIIEQTDTHFPSYRRLGDRLCESIATFLFPADLAD